MNICHSRSTAVRGRRRSSSQSPPRGPFCRTRTGPVEADGAVDAQNAPTAPWKTLCVFHELPQGLSHQVTHEKLRKAPKYRWETRIDPLQLRAESHPRRFCLRGVLADVSSGRSAQRPERGHRTTVRLQFLGLLLRDGGLFDDGLSCTFSSFPILPTTGNDLHLLFGQTAGTCSYRVSSPGGEMGAEGYRCF